MPTAQQYKALVAAFSITFLEIGTFKSFGVLVSPMKEELQTNLMTLGFAIAVSHAMGSFFAPIISKVTESIGERLTIIIGGFMASVGLILSALVNDLSWMTFCFAFVGIGSAMSFIAGILAISKYFEYHNQSTAIGVSYAGGSIGVMLCPPVVEELKKLFGWRAALALVGATNANLIVCGMLIRPIQRYRRIKPSTQINQERTSREKFLKIIQLWKQKLLQPFYVLAVKPIFIAVLVARLFSTMIYSGWAIFLVPHAIDKGISPEKAALLSSIGGVAAIFGRLLPGPILDKEYISVVKLIVLVSLLNSGAYFADHWLYVFWTLSLGAVVNGFYFGLEPVLAFPISVDVLGTDLTRDGFSLTFMPSAIGEMLGGFLIGKYSVTVVS
ncbi:monocarboxylate transporter 7-like [Amphiura filiformis]|uniref:monocarboxylate transporter 7-like n=1 Tax=Amphiura filiformis TaxID=82378 RepID=UPI003B214A93